MTFPSNSGAMSDPDPSTQLAWPTSRRDESMSPEGFRAPLPELLPDNGQAKTAKDAKLEERQQEIGRKRLTPWDLFCLSISMLGAQVVWTVELGYGTPFLLSLGLSEKLTSLVWLAGPISGLIAQPVIGAISDSSKSRYRRRYWVVASTVVLVVSTLVLAYCKEIAAVFVNIFGGGVGDWDPETRKQVINVAIGFAVAAFYLLDFSLNALQASLRNLLLDITPPSQLNSGNAWHGRMTHAGNIVGYGFGLLPLAQLPLLRLLGGSQFRKFCVVAMTILVITVSITCWTQEEKERQKDFRNNRNNRFMDVIVGIWKAIVDLPKPIRRVCYVQIFAYMGWFPYLFYATTYVGQVMAREKGEEIDGETATRMGSVALLCFSVVAVIAGTLLPQLARRDLRLLGKDGEEEEEDAELAHLRSLVQEWRAEAARQGQPLKLPRMPFMLRNIWTGALVLFTLITLSTFFITTLTQAVIAMSATGICWAVACWVPFAIIMEFLKEMDEQNARAGAPATYTTSIPTLRNHTRSSSSPSVVLSRVQRAYDERQTLLRRQSLGPRADPNAPANAVAQPVAGGTVLGIHNLAIVMPQFLIAIISSIIFRMTEDPDNHNTYYGKTGVAWVLRFGGICALAGAFMARKVPPTKTEREMRRRLGELKVLKEQASP